MLSKDLNDFTRQDACILSGLTRTQIGMLEKHGIIKSVKPNSRLSLYTWKDIVELRFIAKIRETVSLQKIREAKEYLNKIDFDTDYLYNKKLVVGSNGILYLIQENEDVLITISGKHKGQFAITQVILCNDIITDLVNNRSRLVIDFEKKLQNNNVPNIRRLIKKVS